MSKRNRTSYKTKKTVGEELGYTGIAISNGKVREESIIPLRGPKKIKLLEEMVKFDSTIGAFNNMYQSTASSVKWSIKPKDDTAEAKKIADFIDECLFQDLNHSFQEVIANALTASQYGFAIIEPVYKVRNGENKDKNKSSKFNDGLIGLAKLASRYQGSITKWNYDENYRNIISVSQKDPNKFEEKEIPYEKLLHFKHRSFNNNPEGASLYLNCVTPYLKKKRTSLNEDIRYERGFDGLLDIQAPAPILDPTTKNPVYLQTQKWIKDTAQNIRAGTDVAIAHPEYIKVGIISSGAGNIPDADKIIAREDRNISVALLSDFFLTAQKSGISGSFSQSKIKIFTNLVKEMLDEIKRVINFKLIPTLLEKNLMDLSLMPTIEFSEIGDLDLTNLMLFIQSADKSGLVPPTLGMCNAILKRLLGNDTPTITQEEFDNYQRRREVNTWAYGSEELAEKTADSAVNPDEAEPIEDDEQKKEDEDK